MSTTYKTLEAALEIVDNDILKIKKMAESEHTLDRGEASKLTDYIKTLISVHKEEREALKSDSLPTKGTAELEDLAKEALELLGMLPEEDKPEEKEKKDEPTNSTKSDDK
jgi:hypothetical protein